MALLFYLVIRNFWRNRFGTDVVLPEEDIRPFQEVRWLKRGIYGFSHVGRLRLTSV